MLLVAVTLTGFLKLYSCHCCSYLGMFLQLSTVKVIDPAILHFALVCHYMFDLHTLPDELLVLSFKTHSEAFEFPLVLPVQTFCSRTGCCLHSCAVLRGHRNSEKNRPVGFRSTTSEADVCLALVKG